MYMYGMCNDITEYFVYGVLILTSLKVWMGQSDTSVLLEIIGYIWRCPSV